MISKANAAELRSLLPDTIHGWQAEGQGAIYSPDNLYEHINGGAELYRSYGFRQSLNRLYTRPQQPDIIVDVFDMGSAASAFGVFMHSRESVDTTFGQGSEYAAGMLNFWRDHYFVSILAYPENEHSRRAVFGLARYIEKSIGQDGALPEIIRLLPQQNLDSTSIRYFRQHVWLNSYFFIAEDNILNIGDDTHCTLAKYKGGNPKPVLLLIEYPDTARAQDAYDSFVNAYNPALQKRSTIKEEGGTWLSVLHHHAVVAIVFNASGRTAAEGFKEQFKKQWKRIKEQP